MNNIETEMHKMDDELHVGVDRQKSEHDSFDPVRVLRRIQHEKSIPGRIERYMYDIEDYLHSKHGDVLADYEIKEIATYAANRFGVSMGDILTDREAEFNRYIKRLEGYWEKEMKRRSKNAR